LSCIASQPASKLYSMHCCQGSIDSMCY
jgi:hypothetical protein